MTVAIVGGGVMGEAILAGAIKQELLKPEAITVVELLDERRKDLAERFGVNTAAEASDVLPECNLVLLAVKPQEFRTISGGFPKDALLVSIMAGVRIKTLASHFNHERIVRVMPNTPAAINAGMSVWVATEAVDEKQRATVRSLLDTIGHQLPVDDEEKLDMATALSGSGPAYVFLFIEALIAAGMTIGLTADEAEAMTMQTLSGAAQYAQESELSPADLRKRVTSKGGTTEAGLHELERGEFSELIKACLRAAYERSKELGEAK
ncbi:MAG: pyrroline-5-carboxylate reductase [Dehalococcoidia bacterium]|nr:pyrroline-5-carboxylate reductase [Dehalococcoidia bacterium]HCV00823.1 pyrroline-5-carboxylate reductase [Dehalococcoidia bacterium]|tara:strand:+ start:5774 stop:6568 length:795 start_codon:yes stop_codon:yes gene_type:complete